MDLKSQGHLRPAKNSKINVKQLLQLNNNSLLYRDREKNGILKRYCLVVKITWFNCISEIMILVVSTNI